MDRDTLREVASVVITIALLLFAFLLVQQALDIARNSERVSPETITAGIFGLTNIIVMAAVARWLQQGAAQAAEKQADKLQEAVKNVAATTGQPMTADTVAVQGEDVTVTESS